MPPFIDDLEALPDETRLLRILRNATFWTPADAPVRASSGAFQDSTKENSCFVLNALDEQHFSKINELYPGSKLAVVTARSARAAGYLVCDDPSDFLPGHAVLCPPVDVRINEYIRMAKALAKSSTIYIPAKVAEL